MSSLQQLVTAQTCVCRSRQPSSGSSRFGTFAKYATRDPSIHELIEVHQRTSQVKDEYIRANGKLAHLHKIAIAYGKEKGLDEKLQQRLDEISGYSFSYTERNHSLTLACSALNQLTAFTQEKENRGLVLRALESNEDVATVKGLLEKVSSLLEVFQVRPSKSWILER